MNMPLISACLAVIAVFLLVPGVVHGEALDPRTSDLSFHYAINGYEPDTWFQEPAGIALDDRSGTLYVLDAKASEIDVFGIEGAPKDRYGDRDLNPAAGIAVDAEGRLYVSPEAGGPIVIVGPKGERNKLELPSAEGEEAPKPGRMAFDRDGGLYVVDRAGCRIYVFGKERKLELKLGGKGDKRGQFKALCDVAVDRQGRIYALDALGTPVQVFDRKGKYLYRFGFRGAGVEDIGIASAIFTDRHDQVWLVDKGQHCLKVFDRSGTFLKKLGAYGTDPGALFQPVDAEMDRFGRVYVAEAGGRRVQVFSLAHPFDRFEPPGYIGD